MYRDFNNTAFLSSFIVGQHATILGTHYFCCVPGCSWSTGALAVSLETPLATAYDHWYEKHVIPLQKAAAEEWVREWEAEFGPIPEEAKAAARRALASNPQCQVCSVEGPTSMCEDCS